MSSITTKVGDKGNTRLWSGEEVRKTDDRVVFCGTIDELVSHIGVCYALVKKDISIPRDGGKDNISLRDELTSIQKKLFTIASEVATTKPKRSALNTKVDGEWVKTLEEKMIDTENSIRPAKDWILPGKTLLSANLDFARCLTRRCERDYIVVTDLGHVENEQALIWLNRLSDFLYLLARIVEENNYRMIKES